MKVFLVKNDNPDNDRLWFKCPGCVSGRYHAINPNRWQFYNGNADSPTIRESILVTWGPTDPDMDKCHSFITDGFIRFESDSTHALSGQNVELPDLTEEDLKILS